MILTSNCAVSARRTAQDSALSDHLTARAGSGISGVTIRASNGWTSSRRCSRRQTLTCTRPSPLIADLLSVPIGNRYQPLGLTPQKRKEEETLSGSAWPSAARGTMAARRPLPSSRMCTGSTLPRSTSLGLLINRVATLRVLLIITFRPSSRRPGSGART